ncbi:MAG: YlmC/YmxH family sporulation protein [Tepidanaerobacteraceae bacterium]|jgi:YlmC/YmxH family sporulation protein|nr:YlmC/YmxH family sporulation protein [Tepidanaerobacteraceae bacterium]
MRLSELSGKEIVNLYDGARMGIIGNSDLVIDENDGKIIYLLIPNKRMQFFLLNEKNFTEVPWDSIKKVGPDIVILEIDNQNSKKMWKF